MRKEEIFSAAKIADQLIEMFELDLEGLNLITELASGNYLFNLLIAAKSKANIYAIGKNSNYGQFDDITKSFEEITDTLDLNTKFINIFSETLSEDVWRNADIVTNSGFVRPIDKTKINLLKETAVIPLMFESWEYRSSDLDIKECQEKGIAVIGTSENNKFINIFKYGGFMTLKLIFQLNLELVNNNIILFGSDKIVEPIVEIFDKLDLNYKLISKELYSDLSFLLNEENIDCIIFAEMVYCKEIFGRNSSLTFKELYSRFPYLKIGHICGNIDVEDLKTSGIEFYPNVIQKPGYMSYQPYFLGKRPIMELYAGSLKVGEIAAKARLSGLSINESIERTVKYGIGQDFEGGFLQFDRR